MHDTDTPFAQAARAIADGDLSALTALLDRHPALVGERSAPPHRATLLHYVAANGVEDELQRTPANAVEICQLLLARGASADALAASYGGGSSQTPLCLLVSSWHPFEAGLHPELIHALVRGGAAVDGLEDDGMPLATALVFGYTQAAEALGALGARVDNLLFAAGLGRLQQVERWFDAQGALRAGARGTYRSPFGLPPAATDAELVQEALHFAVSHGRRETAELLLSKGADPNGRVQGHHCELPLLQAIFTGELSMVPLLLHEGADAAIEDHKRRTTALAYAQQHGSPALVELLLD